MQSKQKSRSHKNRRSRPFFFFFFFFFYGLLRHHCIFIIFPQRKSERENILLAQQALTENRSPAN